MEKTIYDKILTNLPRNIEGVIAQETLKKLIRLFLGDRIYLHPYGWNICGKWKTLTNDRYSDNARIILIRTDIKYVKGNDAPRWGKQGEFIQLTRKNSKLASKLADLIK